VDGGFLALLSISKLLPLIPLNEENINNSDIFWLLDGGLTVHKLLQIIAGLLLIKLERL
jgi:hypothetical protein